MLQLVIKILWIYFHNALRVARCFVASNFVIHFVHVNYSNRVIIYFYSVFGFSFLEEEENASLAMPTTSENIRVPANTQNVPAQ